MKIEPYTSTNGMHLQRATVYMSKRAWDSLLTQSAAANLSLSLLLENLVLANITPAALPLPHASQR